MPIPPVRLFRDAKLVCQCVARLADRHHAGEAFGEPGVEIGLCFPSRLEVRLPVLPLLGLLTLQFFDLGAQALDLTRFAFDTGGRLRPRSGGTPPGDSTPAGRGLLIEVEKPQTGFGALFDDPTHEALALGIEIEKADPHAGGLCLPAGGAGPGDDATSLHQGMTVPQAELERNLGAR